MRGGDAQSEEAEGDKAEKQGKIVRFSRLYCHLRWRNADISDGIGVGVINTKPYSPTSL